MVGDTEEARLGESNQILAMLAALLARRNFSLSEATQLLDLGCGYGTLVQLLRAKRVQAYGADIFPNPLGIPSPSASDADYLRAISLNPYHLPFEDNRFDVTFSAQVFEHVFDLEGTLSELHRVMKPGAIGIHIYPATWRILEGHIQVPFAGAMQSKLWIAPWMRLGIGARAPGLSTNEAIDDNFRYLKEKTCYRSASHLQSAARKFYRSATFIETDYIKSSTGRAKLLQSAGPLLPILGLAYRYFVSRVLWLQK